MRLRAGTPGNEDNGGTNGNGGDTTEPTGSNDPDSELSIAAVSPGRVQRHRNPVSVVGTGHSRNDGRSRATPLENVSVTGTQLC